MRGYRKRHHFLYQLIAEDVFASTYAFRGSEGNTPQKMFPMLFEDDDYDFDDEDEDYEEGFDFGDEDSTIYEVECACGEIIDFDEETLEKGSMTCPNCGETLEFSLEDDE